MVDAHWPFWFAFPAGTAIATIIGVLVHYPRSVCAGSISRSRPSRSRSSRSGFSFISLAYPRRVGCSDSTARLCAAADHPARRHTPPPQVLRRNRRRLPCYYLRTLADRTCIRSDPRERTGCGSAGDRRAALQALAYFISAVYAGAAGGLFRPSSATVVPNQRSTSSRSCCSSACPGWRVGMIWGSVSRRHCHHRFAGNAARAPGAPGSGLSACCCCSRFSSFPVASARSWRSMSPDGAKIYGIRQRIMRGRNHRHCSRTFQNWTWV